jgi:long-subunit acyl-CoA synthetase (AMP-forming)
VEVKIAPDGEILVKGPGILKVILRTPRPLQRRLKMDGSIQEMSGELDPDGF